MNYRITLDSQTFYYLLFIVQLDNIKLVDKYLKDEIPYDDLLKSFYLLQKLTKQENRGE